MAKCWICGLPANSAEHRTKKSDLVTLYGPGPYKGNNALLLIKSGEKIPIQGPNSKYVKYDKILCYKCNNQFTQPFDKAYENFISYIRDNKTLILNKRFIDFQDVYGDEFEVCQRNLFKYFVKSFCCRLIDANYPVPKDLKVLLFRKSFLTRLRINFSINDDPPVLRDLVVGKGNLWARPQKNPPPDSRWSKAFEWRKAITRPPIYEWSEFFEWITVWYWYNRVPDGRLGSVWIANSQFIYCGSHTVLSIEEREKLIEKSNIDVSE
ncbi:hypothetical protein SAMD00079811_60680 [Scytonema sp. HK-05]|uniref:hypothetical protein n=1 Tax=Scytonema sp. HK-05 TaxID=1137095 RepID=UPI00093746EE|nr:hypothetical protein [Scytonema sp. HK-05]OKH46773.1 hypothetical protein NIES2130_36480 [Scytonema sp. HK-05]BAY48444.1 hypothetical protein SAMD00079811_60680 [Scytonema sp. HK-05]